MTPKQAGYRMPGEFEPHAATAMIVPERRGSWPYGAMRAMPAFVEIWRTIAAEERLYLITSEQIRPRVEKLLRHDRNIELLTLPQDDAWARDTLPSFVRDGAGQMRGICWDFNAWGGDYDGLYQDYQQDAALGHRFCDAIGVPPVRPGIVLEGGSIHTDGQGTILTTEACLLSPGRNPDLSREEIAATLCGYLGAEKVLWLPRGIYNDETNEHVDNVCAFLRPGEVVLAWTDDESDPQYALSHETLAYLERVTDARGRRLIVHKLPIPAHPVCVTEDDLAGLDFAPGEDVREPGERLAASYVNFYFTNKSVLLPQFGEENAASDAAAVRLMQSWLPDRRIVPIPARELLMGGGNIHCLTQQIPE
ncbi:MAG: agmatine deiminase [Oscillospiraceae bacterium]|nr:agmatine deiminase [Oscillospiraceae bacterium]